jgi:hypothetical protein
MSEESAKLRREIRELQDRSHSLIQKAKKLVEGSSEELQGDFDGPPRAPTRDYPISIIPSKTRSLSLPIADASVSAAKKSTSARSLPVKPSASKKFTTTSGWLALWIMIWATSILTPGGWNHSTTRSARGCHLCSQYIL